MTGVNGEGYQVLLAGFGGQGVMLAGILLAQAAMEEGFEVAWAPSYGPEMRGGTAHCFVMVEREPVAAPVVSRPRCLVAMNGPSLERFAESVRPGGILVFNRALARRPPERHDVQVIGVDATGWAAARGAPAVANMVLLGALAAAMGVPQLVTLQRALARVIPERHRRLIPLNEQALQAGFAVAG